jgi:hypothetical protein
MLLPPTRHLIASVTAPAEGRPLPSHWQLEVGQPAAPICLVADCQPGQWLPAPCLSPWSRPVCVRATPPRVPAAVYGHKQYLHFSHRPIVCAFRTLVLAPMRRFAPLRPARYLRPIFQRHQAPPTASSEVTHACLPSYSRLVMRRCMAFDSVATRVLTSIAREYPRGGFANVTRALSGGQRSAA